MFFYCFRFAVAAAGLILIFSLVDFSAIQAALKTADKFWLYSAILLWIPNVFLQSVKWFVLLKSVFPAARFSEAGASLFGALALGIITPGRAGELGKAIFLPGYDWRVVSALAVMDIITLLFAKTVLGMLAFHFFPAPLAIRDAPFGAKIVVLFVVIIIVTLAVFALKRFSPRWYSKFSSLIGEVRQTFVRARRRNIIGAAMLSTLFVALFSTQFALVVRAFYPLSISSGASAAVLTNITKTLLPVSFGDLGVREGAAIFIFGKLGVPAEIAVTAALFIFVLNVALPALVGLPILLRAKRKSRVAGKGVESGA